MLDSHVTITEAVKISGYSRVHIYGLIARSLLSTRRSWSEEGPRVLVSRTSLEKYMKSHKSIEKQAARIEKLKKKEKRRIRKLVDAYKEGEAVISARSEPTDASS